MSFISNLLYHCVVVRCQSDEEYSNVSKTEKIGSNQCSWCAGAFIINSTELVRLFSTKEFVDLYHSCLLRGSELRREYGYLQYGENIDNKVLLRQMKIEITVQYIIKWKVDENFIDLLPVDLRSEFYNTGAIEPCDLNEWISDFLGRGVKFMISRFGLSFAAVKLTSDVFLVLDSHTKETGLMKKVEFMRYIMMDSTENFIGYFQVCC